MSLRALWAISLPGTAHDVLFSKKYPTVERRAKAFSQDGYVPLPKDLEMKEAVLDELGILHPSDQFVESRDSCSRKLQKPVFEVTTSCGKLWPVVMYEKYGILLCCLPLVESAKRPPVIDMLGISLGYSLLLRMVEVIGSLPQGANETHQRMIDVHSYLCQVVPFGTLKNIEPAVAFDSITGKLDQSPHVLPDIKPPSWRPVSVKVKSNVSFRVTEHIQAVLYNKTDVLDVFQIYGSVACKADLEHPAPLVAVNLSVAKEQSPVQNLLVNSCVQIADDQNRTAGAGSRTITFIPPRDQFILCKYTSAIAPTQVSATGAGSPTMSRRGSVSSLNSTASSLTMMGQASPATLPIKAYYEMTGTQYEVKIVMKMKLVKGKNFFEYCEVHIPFCNRGPIVSVDISPSVGEVILAKDKRTLRWKIGPKFPSRSHEATLDARLKFGAKWTKSEFDNPFCVGLNSFAMIHFKIPDYTHTTATIDQKSLRVQPSAKPKVTVVREFLSSSYKVWNVKGNSLSADMSDVVDSW